MILYRSGIPLPPAKARNTCGTRPDTGVPTNSYVKGPHTVVTHRRMLYNLSIIIVQR
jgi:hypothetical protein